MIYMDNAATSYPKPSMVLDALWESVARCGNPGRGGSAARGGQRSDNGRGKRR